MLKCRKLDILQFYIVIFRFDIYIFNFVRGTFHLVIDICRVGGGAVDRRGMVFRRRFPVLEQDCRRGVCRDCRGRGLARTGAGAGGGFVRRPELVLPIVLGSSVAIFFWWPARPPPRRKICRSSASVRRPRRLAGGERRNVVVFRRRRDGFF